MKKKLLIILPIAILLLAVIYLFAIPSLQVNNYKTTAKSSQLALASSASNAISAANQNAFLAENVTLAEAKNALKISRDAASAFESKTQTSETSLTDFTELPMVSAVSPNYKAALDLRLLEEKYIQTAKDYANEFKSVNTYNEQTLPLMELAEQFQEIDNEFQAAQSSAELVTTIDKAIAKINEAAALLASTKPAESVKEFHDHRVKSFSELTSTMNQIKTALIAMDTNTIMTLSKSFETESARSQAISKVLIVKMVEESKLAKIGDTLNDLGKQIDLKTAEL